MRRLMPCLLVVAIVAGCSGGDDWSSWCRAAGKIDDARDLPADEGPPQVRLQVERLAETAPDSVRGASEALNAEMEAGASNVDAQRTGADQYFESEGGDLDQHLATISAAAAEHCDGVDLS